MLIFDFYQIGENLLKFRKQTGMTQAEVAEAASLSDRTYADIERGKVNMRMETLLRICQALHITPNDVLTVQASDQKVTPALLQERLQSCSPQERERLLRLIDAFLL